ncbi:MAG: RnfABCDGE type electron transport complex subunit B [Bacillota bacterium]
MVDIIMAVLVIGGLGLVFGIGLSYASKVFAVQVNERVSLVRDVLPGANCGACGYSGCDGYANAVVEGKAPTNACPVGGSSVAEKVAEIMGVEPEGFKRTTARVLCNGRQSISKEKYIYRGISSCAAAAQLYGGQKSCAYGCLGYGDCLKACPFDAIVITGGIARVIEDRCKACGKCVAACPKKLIELIDKDKKYSVMCRSRDKGAVTRNNCQVGCIGCMRCVKACKYDAISMEGTLARIDYSKCVNCGECAKVCPTMAIRVMDFGE